MTRKIKVMSIAVSYMYMYFILKIEVADVNAKVTIDLLCKRVEFEIGYIMPT